MNIIKLRILDGPNVFHYDRVDQFFRFVLPVC